MAEIEIPKGVPSDGMVTVWAATALGTIDKPTTAEVNGPTGLNFTCYLDDAGISVDFDADTITKKRFCMKDAQEVEGTVKWKMPDANIIWDQQNPGSDSNKAYEYFEEQLFAYLLFRFGKSAEEYPELAKDDIVHIYSARIGTRAPAKPEKNSELTVRLTFNEVRRIATDVKIAA